jgi:hypothetical protein
MESELNIANAVALRGKFMRSYPSQLQAIYLSIKNFSFFLKISLAFATYLLTFSTMFGVQK